MTSFSILSLTLPSISPPPPSPSLQCVFGILISFMFPVAYFFLISFFFPYFRFSLELGKIHHFALLSLYPPYSPYHDFVPPTLLLLCYYEPYFYNLNSFSNLIILSPYPQTHSSTNGNVSVRFK